MARTGRPRSTQARIKLTVSLLPEHHAAFEQIDFDPFTGRRYVGNRNQHLDRAIREYLEKYYPEVVNKAVDRG